MIAGHAAAWASVGPWKAASNQRATAGWKAAVLMGPGNGLRRAGAGGGGGGGGRGAPAAGAPTRPPRPPPPRPGAGWAGPPGSGAGGTRGRGRGWRGAGLGGPGRGGGAGAAGGGGVQEDYGRARRWLQRGLRARRAAVQRRGGRERQGRGMVADRGGLSVTRWPPPAA